MAESDLHPRSEIVAQIRAYFEDSFSQVERWTDKGEALVALHANILRMLRRTERRLAEAEKE